MTILDVEDRLYSFFYSGSYETGEPVGYNIHEVINVTPKYADIHYFGSVLRIKRELEKELWGILSGEMVSIVRGSSKWCKSTTLYLASDRIKAIAKAITIRKKLLIEIERVKSIADDIKILDDPLAAKERITKMLGLLAQIK